LLNRLYIVLGVLLILVLGAAFVVPHFVDWSSRRPQMEALASEALGTKVEILGDISFVLLPQPRLRFSKVIVGPAEDPFVEIDAAEADFSLTDFLRDRFAVTKLTLKSPVLYLTIGKDGTFLAPLRLPETVSASNVSIADASIENGRIRLTDQRLDTFREFTDVSGSLSLSALRGPFGLNGSGRFDGAPYQIRINTSQMNASDEMQLSAFLRPDSGAFSITLDGQLATGATPAFSGKATVRQSPPEDENADAGRGDLVLDATLDAGPERIVLSNYVLVPDENRGGTRLTGAASVELGADPQFKAVVSGGVVGLPARDAREDDSTARYELLRLLDELPAPLIPPLKGSLGVDVAELDLHGLAMRNVRLDARSDGTDWTVDDFTGQLPGDSGFHFKGTVAAKDGKPAISGEARLETERLDALAQLWRKPEEAKPLFGVPGSLSGTVKVADHVLQLSDGKLTLDGIDSTIDLTAPLTGGRLEVTAKLGAFDGPASEELAALMPDVTANADFGNSFSEAKFDVSADRLAVFGLDGRSLAARGTWAPDTLDLALLSAGDLGGASFTLTGKATGSLDNPIVTGSGRAVFSNKARAGFAPSVFDALHADDVVRQVFDGFLPGNYQFELKAPNAQGIQALSGEGTADDLKVQFGVNFGEGVTHYLDSPLGVRVEVRADHPEQMLGRFGVPVTLSGDLPGKVTFAAEGTMLNSLDAQLTLDSAADKLQYTGNLIISDPAMPRGRGSFEFDVAEPAVWGELIGAGSVFLPSVKGIGDLSFNGAESVTLSGLNLSAGGVGVSGDMAVSEQAGTPLISGDLKVNALDLKALAALFWGGSALISSGDGVWPDGPFSSGPARTTRGRIHVAAPVVRGGDADLAKDAAFDVIWDETNLRLRSGTATIGGGTMQVEVSACCAGTQGDEKIDGRLGLDKVDAGALLPEALGEGLGGTLSSSLQFAGTGDSIAALIRSLNGQGSFSVDGLKVGGFDPAAFAAVGARQDILDLDAEALTRIVGDALAKGAFTAPEMGGVLNLAGGALRSSNLGADAAKATLFGGLAVDLNTLGLSGDWTLSPKGQVDKAGLINETTARIDSVLGGTLTAPSHALDLASMVDAVKVKAYELEVDRLEKLKAEDEARQRAAAEERARRMALEAKQKAEEAAAKLAEQRAAEQKAREEAAQKAAAEKAAADKAAEEAARKKAAEDQAAEAAAQQKAAAERAVQQKAMEQYAVNPQMGAETAAQPRAGTVESGAPADTRGEGPAATDLNTPVTPPDQEALDQLLQESLDATRAPPLPPCGPNGAPVDLLGTGNVTLLNQNCVVQPAR